MNEQQLEVLVENLTRGISDRLTGQFRSVKSSPESSARPDHSGHFAIPEVESLTPADVARFIDHTMLKPEATHDALETLCEEATTHGFFSVCVHPSHVARVKRLLENTSVQVCTVVGFPLGTSSTPSKAFEASQAVDDGADEIDMVLHRGALLSRDYRHVLEDMLAVVESVPDALVKVILETAALDEENKRIACALAKASGAHFVKTSTGFGPGGATADDVELMREVVGPDMGVKASGGVRSFEHAVTMLRAGASRLGCSSSVAIVSDQIGSEDY